MQGSEVEHLFLSPHLDDVCLSCGGAVYEQAFRGKTTQVVTIFGGAPDPDTGLSAFARQLHRRWGHVADAVKRRQEEDRAALTVLGATAEHWPYADCIYRQRADGTFPYDSEESLWGPIDAAEEEGLLHNLAARLQRTLSSVDPDGCVYAPLAIGNHVDHQIVRQVVDQIAPSIAQTVLFYEDFPYAEDFQTVSEALAKQPMEARLCHLSKEAMTNKIKAIACYTSQISTFWSNVAEMAKGVKRFAEAVGEEGRPAERFWTPMSKSSVA